MTTREGDPASRGAAPQAVGGKVRRIAIVTVGREPWACYLARKLQSSNVEIFLFSQTALKVEPGSVKYYRRLFKRRGLAICLDVLLLHAVKAVAKPCLRVLRGVLSAAGRRGKNGSERAGSETLWDAESLWREDWLTCVDVENINRGSDRDRLREIAPDLILLAGAPILSRKTIEAARLACINPHCGITPDYAGPSPIDWAIYERRFDDIGFTIHLVVPTVDAGPVLYQERIRWNPGRVNGHLWPILARKMYDKLAEMTLELIAGKDLTATPQENVRVNPPAGLFARSLAEMRRIRHALHRRPSAG
jgi:hypothetical protein